MFSFKALFSLEPQKISEFCSRDSLNSILCTPALVILQSMPQLIQLDTYTPIIRKTSVEGVELVPGWLGSQLSLLLSPVVWIGV